MLPIQITVVTPHTTRLNKKNVEFCPRNMYGLCITIRKISDDFPPENYPLDPRNERAIFSEGYKLKFLAY